MSTGPSLWIEIVGTATIVKWIGVTLAGRMSQFGITY